MCSLCWRWTLLVMDTNTTCTFCAGDKCIENTRSNFSHAHTASYRYSPPTGSITLSYSSRTHLRVRYTHKLYLRNSVLCFKYTKLIEKDKRTSTDTQLVPSELVVACNAHVQYSGCSLTIHGTPQLLCKKPKKCLTENVKHLGDSLEAATHQS